MANWESPVSSYMALATIDHVQGYEMGSWTGIVAPAGTPKDIINKMSSAMAINLAMPDINEKLVSTGMQPFISTPAQFAAIMKADLARFAKIIKTANISRLIAWWVASGQLRPLITARYPLEHAAAAMSDLMHRRISGKAVLEL